MEKSTTNTTIIPGLSDRINVHDIGGITNSSAKTSLLKQNLLFVSTPIEFATTSDKQNLRQALQIKTIVNTLPRPGGAHYIHHGPTLAKKTEDFALEDVLGLTSCRVVFRYDEFIKNAMREMTPWSNIDPALLEKSRDLLWKRSNIDDNTLILILSAPLMARLFNEVLCKPHSYPLILSGDRIIRDPCLIIFLLLLVLEVPFSANETTYLKISEGLPFKVDEESDRQWEKDVRFEASAWKQARSQWASVLRQRLEGRYGSVQAYFSAIGVTEATRNDIKSILLAGENKDLIDFS